MRLFVAIYPPPEIAAQLVEAVKAASLPGTPMDAAKVHLTLLFIGECDPRQLPEVKESVERSAAGLHDVRLTINRIVAWPPGHGARMAVALAEASPDLLEIQRRLATRLARNTKDRGARFTPHLTLQRYPAGSVAEALDLPVGPLEMRATEIRLMRSVLTPNEARHDLLLAANVRDR